MRCERMKATIDEEACIKFQDIGRKECYKCKEGEELRDDLGLPPIDKTTIEKEDKKMIVKKEEDNEDLGILNKVKSIIVNERKPTTFDSEEFEVAILWLNNEVTSRQVNLGYGSKGDGGITRMAKVIKEMYRLGKITLK